MRIIVTGGRDYDDPAAVAQALAVYVPSGPHTLVHGACKVTYFGGRPHRLKRYEKPGADRLAHFFALAYGWTVEQHPANWSAYGRGAGPVRNRHMASLGADLCIAFPGGDGTRGMVEFAEAAGIPVLHIRGRRDE